MSAIEWTEAHRREALRRCYELAAELAAETRATLLADTLARAALGACRGLGRFSALLVTVGHDAARIERELRRVDGLATGRLVREVWYCIRWRGSDDLFGRSQSRADAEVSVMRERPRGARDCIVRVTRIRRAP